MNLGREKWWKQQENRSLCHCLRKTMLIICHGHLQFKRPTEADCQFQKSLCIFFIIISGRILGSWSTYERTLNSFKNIAAWYKLRSRSDISCERKKEWVKGVWPDLVLGLLPMGLPHVLLSWQPLENTKLSKCWSSAFSFMRCSSKESTSLSLCSIICIISVSISCSSFGSFSSFWLSTEKNKQTKINKNKQKHPHWTSGKTWPQENFWHGHSWLFWTCSAL